MATNLALDPDLLDRVVAVSGQSTKKAAVTLARKGVQIGTIDALLIQLCGRFDLTLLSTDADFEYASEHVPFKLWRPGG